MDEIAANIGLYLAYFLIAISVISVIALPLVAWVKNPTNITKKAIFIGGLVTVFIGAYALSDDTLYANLKEYTVSPMEIKVAGALLITMYSILVLTFLSAIYAELAKLFK